MAQNTSDNSECLAESWRLEGKTEKTEDIAGDVDSRKCQNTSTQETLTNSKISGKTSDPEDFSVQTHHLSLQTDETYTDETYEKQSEEESVNLNEFQNEPLKNPKFQSEKTRDDSVPLIRETLMTKLEDSNYSAETCHPEVPPDQLAYHTDRTSEEKYEEKSENLITLQDNMSDETCNVPDLQLNHPSQILRDPSEVIPRDLKHNFPETHGDIIVGHGKFKPTEPTDNTITEKQTQSVHTTKTLSSYGLLILTTILILIQLYVFTDF